MADPKANIVISAEDRTRAAFASATANLRSLGTLASGALARLGPLVGTVGALGAAVSLVNFKNIVNGIDALNDLKDATGASIENISALEDIADRTGSSFDAVGASLVKLNQGLKDAKPDNPVAQTLKAIGLSADELRQQDPAEALRQVAVALGKYADDGNKARIVQELFGRSVREVAPFLKDLSEQSRLNAKVTTEQAEAAEKFNKQVFQLERNIKDAARSIVSDMVPALNTFFEKVREGSQNGGFFARIKKELQANLVSDQLRVVTGQIETIQNTINRQGSSPVLEKRLAALREEAAALTDQALAASDALKRATGGVPLSALPQADYSNEGGVNRARPTAPVIVPRSPTAAARQSEAERYLEALRRQLDAAQDLTAVEQVLADIQGKRIEGISAATAGQAIELAKQIDAAKAKTELERDLQRSRELGAQIAERSLQALQSESRGIADVNQSLRDQIPEIGATWSELTKLEQTRLDDAVATKQQTLAQLQNAGASQAEIQTLEEQIRLLRERKGLLADRDAKINLEEQRRAREQLAEGIAGTITDTAIDAIIDGDWRSAGLRIGRDLTRGILEDEFKTVRESLKKLIEGGLSDSGGNLGGGLVSAIGRAFGGTVTPFNPSGERDLLRQMEAASNGLEELRGSTVDLSSVFESLPAAISDIFSGIDFGGSGGGGGLLDGLAGLFLHRGGIAGEDGSPTRYHTGGIAGLRPDEVPAILQRGEEVLTRGDPRHRDNGGRSITVNSKATFVIQGGGSIDRATLGQAAARYGRMLSAEINRGTA